MTVSDKDDDYNIMDDINNNINSQETEEFETELEDSNSDSDRTITESPVIIDAPQDSIQVKLDTNSFKSAFHNLLKFRQKYAKSNKHQSPKKTENNENSNTTINAQNISNIQFDDSIDKLKRVFKKSDALKMKVIGQFNLGFIIGKLNNDLFIIDQHATDEIYNYEKLIKNHKIKSQPLLIPKYISLTTQEETSIIENLDIFEKNGFKFNIKPNNLPKCKCQLTSMPQSLNKNKFDIDDIHELASLLSEHSRHTLTCLTQNNDYHDKLAIRPTKAKAIFASRACRSSIMIGTALTKNTMYNIVRHMNELNSPWNCPHGRPTMRHLFDLNMLDIHFKKRGQFSDYKSFGFS